MLNIFQDDQEDEKSYAPEEMGWNIGVDLDDPDVQNSVTKIQAGYKGMRFRQKQRTAQVLIALIARVKDNFFAI